MFRDGVDGREPGQTHVLSVKCDLLVAGPHRQFWPSGVHGQVVGILTRELVSLVVQKNCKKGLITCECHGGSTMNIPREVSHHEVGTLGEGLSRD